jgi:hypothetical protein
MLLVVSACAVPHPNSVCDTAPAQRARRRVATPSLVEAARQRAGARTVHVIAHDAPVTKEYDTTRLSLQLDARGQVVRVFCG